LPGNGSRKSVCRRKIIAIFTDQVTVPGQITVPAATYTQDPITGAYTVNPGVATLVVTGTI
jgi:hypothetical protein